MFQLTKQIHVFSFTATKGSWECYTSLECFRDSWMCEAKTENNPLCGSFLPRFTGLSESWITGNQFQNCYKRSQIFFHCSMNNLQENEEVCQGFAHHSCSTSCDTARAKAELTSTFAQCWRAQSWALLHWTEKLEIAQEKYHKVICKTLPADVTSLTQYSSSGPPGIQTPMI